MNRENAVPQLHFVSTSSASDGSFVAIAEIGALLDGEPHRLIGGVAVVLHQHRVGIDHPIRATADADFGVPPYALKDDSLVDSVASLGYQHTSGNRWVRAHCPISARRPSTCLCRVTGLDFDPRCSTDRPTRSKWADSPKRSNATLCPSPQQSR